MHGRGKFLWSDGRIYEGQYKNNKKEGFGIFNWPSGARFEGTWVNGKQHGKGKLIINGVERKGKWENGRLIKKY